VHFGTTFVLEITIVIMIATKTYLLRAVPVTLWRAAKARAAIEGKPMRTVLISALEDYAGTTSSKTARRGQKKKP
jgi:hypothetical protein